MKRTTFIKAMAGSFGLAVMPNMPIKEYQKVYLKHVFIRGFQYYDGPEIIDTINKTGRVYMVREPDNPYDEHAIAIYFESHKLGYLPRESNKTLSILMDTDLLRFYTKITHIRKDAANWEKISIAVYALKEIASQSDYEKIKPFSTLKTPHYYSIETEDDLVIHWLRG